MVAALGRERLPSGARVLDLCTGSGLLAVAAARAGAKEVTAVDISWRAVWTARTNARLRRLPVTVRRGDLGAPVLGERFDLVLANPGRGPARGPVRPGDAGPGVLVGRTRLHPTGAARGGAGRDPGKPIPSQEDAGLVVTNSCRTCSSRGRRLGLGRKRRLEDQPAG
ncbi:methyltransferase [Actinopolymorpha pittospori]|uniref:methyltransferase n=1 Tax=Actinopolymorpha pittospori TaxID=648752 RepID=UPI003B5860C2